MKTATILLVAVTVFTTLFLESSTNPLESVADVDVTNTLTVPLAPNESATATATVASLKEEVIYPIVATGARVPYGIFLILLRNALNKRTSEKMNSSDAALAVVKSAVDEGLAKTKDKLEMEVLTALKVFLVEFGSMTSKLHDAIRAAVASGTSEALENVIPSLKTAIEDTVENKAKQLEALEATPGKCVSRVKVVVETEFATIIANANVVLKAMEEVAAA